MVLTRELASLHFLIIQIRKVPLRETSPFLLKAMRGSLLLPRFQQFFTTRPYPYPSNLPLRSPFFRHLSSSTQATKQPLSLPSKPPLITQSSSPSSSKPFASPEIISEEDYTPRPLSRPLGQLQPPQPGENSGVDPRSWRERRADFFNYDKHLERRKQLYVFRPHSSPPISGPLFCKSSPPTNHLSIPS